MCVCACVCVLQAERALAKVSAAMATLSAEVHSRVVRYRQICDLTVDDESLDRSAHAEDPAARPVGVEDACEHLHHRVRVLLDVAGEANAPSTPVALSVFVAVLR